MIIRFAVKTVSGSYYYVEDHSHLFGHPTWLIYVKNKPSFIVRLADDASCITGKLAKDIDSINQFRGKRIVYYKHQVVRDEGNVMWHTMPQTSAVAEIISFK